jgi:DNA-binding transcriptional LysR family regulator
MTGAGRTLASVSTPCMSLRDVNKATTQLLARVLLAKHAHKYPAQLSREQQQRVAEVSAQPRFTTDKLMLVKEAALAGLGIAQLPEVLCATEVHTGRLQVALPGWAPPSIAIHALFPSRRFLTPAGRTFLEMLGKAFLVLGRVPA